MVAFAIFFLSIETHGREIGFEPERAPPRRPEMTPGRVGVAD
jgi:hypothetical protein